MSDLSKPTGVTPKTQQPLGPEIQVFSFVSKGRFRHGFERRAHNSVCRYFPCSIAVVLRKLIAAGEAAGGVSVIGTPTGTDFAVVRYNPNGSLDTTFGTGGKVTTDFLGADDIGFSVALLATGKIVVAGAVSHRSLKSDIALARYNPDGTLDTAFGIAGHLCHKSKA